jgi:hypothetical protein
MPPSASIHLSARLWTAHVALRRFTLLSLIHNQGQPSDCTSTNCVYPNIPVKLPCYCVRFEFFTAVTMKKAVFWDVAPCRYGVTFPPTLKQQMLLNSTQSVLLWCSWEHFTCLVQVVMNSHLNTALFQPAFVISAQSEWCYPCYTCFYLRIKYDGHCKLSSQFERLV